MKTFVSVLSAIIVAYILYLSVAWITGPSALEKSIARMQSANKAYNEAKCQAAGYRKNCLD
jgi:hypothetical protein